MIRDLFKAGQQKMLDEGAAEEATKTGRLRGGSVGMINEKGDTIGSCQAMTYLRYKGIVVEDIDPATDLMFDAGRRNEDHWYDVLKNSWDGTILREEEVATCWETDAGIKVTGRPDIVLVDKEGEKVVGIELKQVCSLWTARDVVFGRKPKLNHLMQAAHYSWQLGIPFELWYTGRSDFAVTGDWSKKLFPRSGEPGSEHCQYAYYEDGEINKKTGRPIKRRLDNEETYMLKKAKGLPVYCDILKVRPFIQGYLLDIHDGKLYVKDAMVDDAPWEETIVTVDQIKRFYNTVSEIKTVPKEPKVLNFDGSKGNYKMSQYCSLGELCCGKCPGQDINSWTDKVLARKG